MQVGPLLKYWRENRNYTYYRMAQISGIDADYIKKIEDSTIENDPNIKIETLERLAQALDIPTVELISNNEKTMYLSPRERELITIFRRFGEKEQAACIAFLDSMSEKQE